MDKEKLVKFSSTVLGHTWVSVTECMPGTPSHKAGLHPFVHCFPGVKVVYSGRVDKEVGKRRRKLGAMPPEVCGTSGL